MKTILTTQWITIFRSCYSTELYGRLVQTAFATESAIWSQPEAATYSTFIVGCSLRTYHRSSVVTFISVILSNPAVHKRQPNPGKVLHN